ncbi:hypothetical protein HanPSC8_Chr12g0512741 [Helianthus annuus]|nr:hypothetical protein HanPSC8_Chr12g0512741 [Helianthus annuus]
MKKMNKIFDLLGHSLSLSLSLSGRFFRERKFGFLMREKERSQIRNLHTNKRTSKNSDIIFVNIRSPFYSLFFAKKIINNNFWGFSRN